jgi:DmsE family decaheme c-type cytochrome
LMLMLGASILSANALATSATKADAAGKTATAQAKDTAPGDFVGADVCATCHKEVAEDFANNPHSKTTKMHGRNGVSCEDCHGAGQAHVESGDKAKIFNPANGTTKEVDAKCLECHLAKHRSLDDSAHAEGNVSCIGCHDIHHSKVESLLKAPQPTLCYQCHTEIKPQFSMPFHHKVNEGLVQCSDCHDPHGAYKKKGLKPAIEQDAFCVKCHTEMAGPFVYEHAVVKTEGCTACHFPHGGPNPHLLNRANVDAICLQCHSPSPNFTTFTPAGPYHNQAAQSQSCLTCHASIHGSNVSRVFFKQGD